MVIIYNLKRKLLFKDFSLQEPRGKVWRRHRVGLQGGVNDGGAGLGAVPAGSSHHNRIAQKGP